MKEYNDSPSDEASLHNHSRRKFLARAGASALAIGASALTLPFLEKSVHAGTANCFTVPGGPPDGCTNVVNIPSPNPWFIRGSSTDTICGYNAAQIAVSGVRHYCGQDIIPWGTAETNPNRPPFPERPDGASFCMTIYPIVDKLLKRNRYAGTSGYDDDLEPFFNSFQVRDMLSCWHEVANVTPKKDKDGHTITGADAVDMQKYLLDFRNNLQQKMGRADELARRVGLTKPKFGAIESPANHNGSTDYGVSRCAPFMMPGLDFYGQDLYRNNFSDPTKPLAAWDMHFGSGSTYTPSGAKSKATIAVCECNCENPAFRPNYFTATAYWLWHQKNKGARCFLTFWNYGCKKNESGPWLPDDAATIAALQTIGNGEYSQ